MHHFLDFQVKQPTTAHYKGGPGLRLGWKIFQTRMLNFSEDHNDLCIDLVLISSLIMIIDHDYMP